MYWRLLENYIYDMVRTKKGDIKGIKFIKIDKLQYKIYDKDGNFKRTLEVDTLSRDVTDVTSNTAVKGSITSILRKEVRDNGGDYRIFVYNGDDEYEVSGASNTVLSTYLKGFSKYEGCRLKNMTCIFDCIEEVFGKKDYYTNTEVKRVMSRSSIYESQGMDLELQTIEQQQQKCGVANLYLLDLRRDKIIFSVDFLVANEGKAVSLVKENPKEYRKLLKLYYDKFGQQDIPFERFSMKCAKVITGMTLDFICYPKNKEDLLRIKPTVVRPSLYNVG